MRHIFSLFFLAASVLTAGAETLPTDPVVRKGQLANGLTYYIAHNAQTPHVADFYIAQRVGSILEEPRQRGLAHFLEHMAFNGSRHFPGGNDADGIVKWCESVGIKFGQNLNAYTSVDQTVYNISAAPVVREGVVDTCLLILSDWSHDLLLTDEEIDKERGVIHEEWRTRRSGMAMQRLMENAMPTVYAGSKYADAMPIGSMDVVDHFAYNDLRDYYHKWYRPDLQAIIIVGDIDVDRIEQKIRTLFSSVTVAPDAAERIYYPVPDNDRMIVYSEQDSEQPTTAFTLYMKRDATDRSQRNTVEDYTEGYKSMLVRSMLNDRIDELTDRTQPPFISGGVRDGGFFLASTKDAFSIFSVCQPQDVKGSIDAVVAEVERARQHGFTPSELSLAKTEILRRAEVEYASRDDRRNGHIVSACVANFCNGDPMLSPADELNLVKRLDAAVTLDEVNAAARAMITDRNQVVTLYGPKKEGFALPSHEEIEKTILEAQARKYDAYAEKTLPKTLMKKKPKAGKIVSEKADKHGYTCLTLSNGMHVYVRHTDFEADDVSVRFFSRGGRSLYPDADVPSLSYLASTIAASGVSTFDQKTLEKMLAGKTVRLSPYVAETSEGMSGSSDKASLETLMQLAYLYFTAPRRDDTAFQSLINRQRSFLANRNASPTVTYNDSLRAILYDNNPRMAPMTVETLDRVSLDRIMQIYAERFADAADFNVIITGSMTLDDLRPLLRTYLASLPATHKAETEGSHEPRLRRADETHLFTRAQSTPTSTTTIYITADMPYTEHNDMCLDVLSQTLRMAYTKKVREEKGGTYGVSVSGDLSRTPSPEALLKINFRTDPAKYAELIPIIYAELDSVAQHGPSAEYLDQVKEYEYKTYGQVKIMNNYWHTVMYEQVFNGIDIDHDYTDRVRALTTDDIRNFARTLLSQKHRIEVTMQ